MAISKNKQVRKRMQRLMKAKARLKRQKAARKAATAPGRARRV